MPPHPLVRRGERAHGLDLRALLHRVEAVSCRSICTRSATR